MTTSGLLVVIRHGESEWNARGVWTGLTDIELDAKGFEEGAKMGRLLADIKFDQAFASTLVRTHETLEAVLKAADQTGVPTSYSSAINERDYGDYTGENKWQVKAQIGEENFNKLRRDWDYPVPHGETLKMVAERTVPFYLETIVPLLLAGKNVIVVAHGNSIRSLAQYIESIPPEEISKVEMIFGMALLYHIGPDGRMIDKSVRQIETTNPTT